VHFAVSGVEVSPFIPPLVAFAISIFTSMGGVSGAFLLLPFQVSVLGYASPSVSATNQLFNVVAIPSGVLRYLREGRMVWPLTAIVVIGTLPGVLVGAVIRVRFLPDPVAFKVFAGLVLLYLGIRMVRDLLRPSQSDAATRAAELRFQQAIEARRQKRCDDGNEAMPGVVVRTISPTRICYEFYGEVFDVSSLGIFSLSLIVGVVGGIYGIGGGAIIAPFFVSFFRLPVYTVAGAALMGTFVTSVAGVATYQVLASLYPDQTVAPDWPLGLLFGIGGMAGMYCGARLQKHVPATMIKALLTVVILLLAVKYGLTLLDWL
jgi:uncharacterized membrane protein YfcA